MPDIDCHALNDTPVRRFDRSLDEQRLVVVGVVALEPVIDERGVLTEIGAFDSRR
jgi:hypothetical protein